MGADDIAALEAQLTRAWSYYSRYPSVELAEKIKKLTDAILYAKRK